jgi:hypothetical protein
MQQTTRAFDGFCGLRFRGHAHRDGNRIADWLASGMQTFEALLGQQEPLFN